MVSRQLLGDVKFTYKWYQLWLSYLDDEGYAFRLFGRRPVPGDIFLRHDVTLSIDEAFSIARLEAKMGIQSTYFIWLSSPLFNALERNKRETIRDISTLGHDIGLHFDTHTHWGSTEPSRSELEERIERERSLLSGIVSDQSPAVSFRQPPSWIFGKEFDGFDNVYADSLFSDIEYLADSQQRWRDEPPRVGDKTEAYQILTHPGLWGEEDAECKRRVNRCVMNSCRNSNRRAREEFVDVQH